jgi:hypothetical protein
LAFPPADRGGPVIAGTPPWHSSSSVVFVQPSARQIRRLGARPAPPSDCRRVVAAAAAVRPHLRPFSRCRGRGSSCPSQQQPPPAACRGPARCRPSAPAVAAPQLRPVVAALCLPPVAAVCPPPVRPPAPCGRIFLCLLPRTSRGSGCFSRPAVHTSLVGLDLQVLLFLSSHLVRKSQHDFTQAAICSLHLHVWSVFSVWLASSAVYCSYCPVDVLVCCSPSFLSLPC